MKKIESMTEVHGLATGDRGVTISFVCEDETRCSVTYDFYGNGRDFDGAEYRRLEASALRSVIASGRTPKSWTAYVIN